MDFIHIQIFTETKAINPTLNGVTRDSNAEEQTQNKFVFHNHPKMEKSQKYHVWLWFRFSSVCASFGHGLRANTAVTWN